MMHGKFGQHLSRESTVLSGGGRWWAPRYLWYFQGRVTLPAAPRNIFQGRLMPPAAPENGAHFQGRLMAPAAPGNHFQGRLVMPPTPEKHNKYLAAHHLPPPVRTVLSRERCCPNFPCIINRRGEVLNSISLKLEALGGKQHLILCFF